MLPSHYLCFDSVKSTYVLGIEYLAYPLIQLLCYYVDIILGNVQTCIYFCYYFRRALPNIPAFCN